MNNKLCSDTLHLQAIHGDFDTVISVIMLTYQPLPTNPFPMLKYGFIVLLFLNATCLQAANNPVTLDTLSMLPTGSEASLLVWDTRTQATVLSHEADALRPPASVLKMVTALAAKLELGDDYRFNTDLELKDSHVVFRFSGDPTLRRDDIRRLVEKLKHEKTLIQGNIYLNGGRFDEFELADGLPWDNLGICYSAPSSSLSLDDNCAVAKMEYSDKNQTQLGFKISRDAPITITNRLYLTEGLEKRYCKFKLLADASNHYQLGGCLGKHEIPRFLSFAVQNTELYVADIIKRELKQAGIEFQGKILRDDRASGRLVARHESAPLQTLLDEMLKDSDNLIADNLLKAIGNHHYNEPGGFDNGVSAVKAVLKEQAGIDLGNAALADGSGLSRNNRMSAAQIMAVVQYVFSHPDLKLVQALAVSGISGTLRYRYSLRGDNLKGRVMGKTGSLFGTFNIAGILMTKTGKPLLFVQLVTNYHHPEFHRHEKNEIRAFEKKFYQSLYEYQ